MPNLYRIILTIEIKNKKENIIGENVNKINNKFFSLKISIIPNKSFGICLNKTFF